MPFDNRDDTSADMRRSRGGTVADIFEIAPHNVARRIDRSGAVRSSACTPMISSTDTVRAPYAAAAGAPWPARSQAFLRTTLTACRRRSWAASSRVGASRRRFRKSAAISASRPSGNGRTWPSCAPRRHCPGCSRWWRCGPARRRLARQAATDLHRRHRLRRAVTLVTAFGDVAAVQQRHRNFHDSSAKSRREPVLRWEMTQNLRLTALR